MSSCHLRSRCRRAFLAWNDRPLLMNSRSMSVSTVRSFFHWNLTASGMSLYSALIMRSVRTLCSTSLSTACSTWSSSDGVIFFTFYIFYIFLLFFRLHFKGFFLLLLDFRNIFGFLNNVVLLHFVNDQLSIEPRQVVLKRLPFLPLLLCEGKVSSLPTHELSCKCPLLLHHRSLLSRCSRFFDGLFDDLCFLNIFCTRYILFLFLTFLL